MKLSMGQQVALLVRTALVEEPVECVGGGSTEGCCILGDSEVAEVAWTQVGDVMIAVHIRSTRSSPIPVDNRGLEEHLEAEDDAVHVIVGFRLAVH